MTLGNGHERKISKDFELSPLLLIKGLCKVFFLIFLSNLLIEEVLIEGKDPEEIEGDF